MARINRDQAMGMKRDYFQGVTATQSRAYLIMTPDFTIIDASDEYLRATLVLFSQTNS